MKKFALVFVIIPASLTMAQVASVKQATHSAKEIAYFIGNYSIRNLIIPIIPNHRPRIEAMKSVLENRPLIEKLEIRFGNLPPGLSMRTMGVVNNLQVGKVEEEDKLNQLITTLTKVRMEPFEEWSFVGNYPYQGIEHQRQYEHYLDMAKNAPAEEIDEMISTVLFTEQWNYIEFVRALVARGDEDLNYRIVRDGLAHKRIIFNEYINFIYITSLLELIGTGSEKVMMGIIDYILTQYNWAMAKIKVDSMPEHHYGNFITAIICEMIRFGNENVKVAIIEKVLPLHLPSEYHPNIIGFFQRDQSVTVRLAIDNYLRTTYFQDVQEHGDGYGPG